MDYYCVVVDVVVDVAAVVVDIIVGMMAVVVLEEEGRLFLVGDISIIIMVIIRWIITLIISLAAAVVARALLHLHLVTRRIIIMIKLRMMVDFTRNQHYVLPN